MEEEPQLLFCGFCGVPGSSAAGARLHQLIAAIPDDFLVDAIATRGPDEPHIERVGVARLMRVPVKDAFEAALAAYQRGLQRQITSDSYDLVYCADIFSAQIATALKESRGYSLVVEINDLPAGSFHRRYPVSSRDKSLRKRWHAAERAALRAADRVVASSRHAARLLSELVDPRKVVLVSRAVDRTLFTPPTVEIALDDRKTVVVFGGPEGRESTRSAVDIVTALREAADPASVRIAWVGQPGGGLTVPAGAELIAVDGPARIASTLADADVVVIPTAADAGAELWGVPHRALEAMACGRATVIVGEAASFSDVVTEESAAVVAPGSAARVARAALELLDDTARRDAMGSAAQKAVEEHADLEAQRERFASLISDLVGVAMQIRAGESTAPYEATRLQATPNVTASLPPPPVIEVKSADIALLDLSADDFSDDGAFDARPTDIESRPHVAAPGSSGARVSTDPAARPGTEQPTPKPSTDEPETGSETVDVTAPSESLTDPVRERPNLEPAPPGARSLAVAAADADVPEAAWDGSAMETEILERAPEVDDLATQQNAPPEVSSGTFATLQAIQAEVDAGSDNPWGDAAANDTIADAAPLVFESQSGKNPIAPAQRGLLADDEPRGENTVENEPAVAERSSEG